MNGRIMIVFMLLALVAGCQPAEAADTAAATPADSAQDRLYEHADFSLIIPVGWATKEEVWERPMEPGADFYALGVGEVITLQYPAQKGEGKAFFSVATAPLAAGEDLESRFRQAYEDAVPEVEDAVEQAFEFAAGSGYEIHYRRPWGEPWWQFRDIWLERDGVVYVLSFHSAPAAFDTYTTTLDQIVASFTFTD